MEQPYKVALWIGIGLLMGCATGVLSLEAGRNAYQRVTVGPHAAIVRSDIQVIETALEEHSGKCGELPETLAQLDERVETRFRIRNDGVAQTMHRAVRRLS